MRKNAMKKNWIALVALFVVVIGAATVAAQSDSGAKLSGTVRVSTWESGDNLQYWNNAVSAFEAANPGVKVEVESVPQDYGTKILAEFAAGSAPDIFQIGDGDAAKWQSQGVVEDLAPYISGSNGFNLDDLYPGVAAFGKVAGSTYYLTKDYSPLVLYYNKDQFKQAGVDFPTDKWTQDDFLKAAQKLTLDANGNDATSDKFDPSNIQRWGVWLPNSWGDTTWERGILPIIYQFGGSQVSEDGKTTTGYMNSDANVAALQWYVDLFKKYHVAPSKTDYASFSGADLFSTQQVAMMWTGIWPMNSYITGDSALKFNWGSNILPAGPKGNANALCWAGFGLYSQSKNKDAAWAFLKYIAAGDGAKEFAKYALTDVKAIVAEQGLDKDPYKGSVIADLANVKPIPESSTPYWADCGYKYFTQELATVLEGDAAVKDAMDKAASEADACLADKAKAS
jgi:multiple sugar transport system substrate-binding protein